MTNISPKNKLLKNIKGKKILYIITQTKWGGAQKYVLELAQYFAKDNEIHVAFGEEKNKDPKFLKTLEKLNIKAIPVPYLVRKIDLGKDYLALMEILKIYNTEKYSLIHLNSSKVGLLGSLAARMYSANIINTKVRLIYTAHGFVFNEVLSKIKKKMYKFSEKISCAIEDIIITVSEADKQSAIDNKITYEQKIFTIHNGINIDNQDFYTKEKALEKLNLSNNYKYFGTIASFYTSKGHQYLIEAIKILKSENSPILKNHKWLLIGNGPELNKIKKQVKEYNLEKNIEFLGEKENASKYLKAFDYFVLPSTKEGLPYTILEAGLAKIPIIATKVGGIPEIIKNEQTGLLISPANPLSLVKSIKKIISDNDLANKMSEKNYQNIKENFDLKQSLQKTKEVYQKLF